MATVTAIVGSPWQNSLPLLVQIGLALLIIDLAGYLMHRAYHDVTRLWPIHAVHHTPDQVNTFNNNAAHFLNIALGTLAQLLSVLLLGFPDEAIVVVATYGTIHGFVVHADTPMTSVVIGRLIMTPAHHRLHHSTVAEEAGNHATLFTLLDRLGGTYVSPDVGSPRATGLLRGYAVPERAPTFHLRHCPGEHGADAARHTWAAVHRPARSGRPARAGIPPERERRFTTGSQEQERTMSTISRRIALKCISGVVGATVFGGLLPGRATAACVDPQHAGYIPVKGGRVWYRMNGSEHVGSTPLLVIHGGPGFSHQYLLPLTDLASDRPVIFYDQLDSGNSERPGDPANWTVERFVSEVDSVREALGLHRLLILGSSWGGTVAAEYAMRQPKGLVGVVLASPLISTPRWIADNTGYRNQLPAGVREVLDHHEEAGTTDSQEYLDAVMVFYRRHLCRLDPWPDYVNRAFELANFDLYVTMWGNTEFNATGTLRDYDASTRLERIEAPTLYTCGEYDEATPAACRHFSSLTPGSEVRVIPDASHMAFAEQRDIYMDTLRRFFSQVA